MLLVGVMTVVYFELYAAIQQITDLLSAVGPYQLVCSYLLDFLWPFCLDVDKKQKHIRASPNLLFLVQYKGIDHTETNNTLLVIL